MNRDKELRSIKNARKVLCRGSSHCPISCRLCPNKILKGQEYYAKSGGYEWHVTCVDNMKNNIDGV